MASIPTFRGRIFNAERDGYRPRQEVERLMRAAIGSILCKPQWWLKWRGIVGAGNENGKSIADKWLDEVARGVLQNRFDWFAKRWRCWFMDRIDEYQEQVLRRIIHFPPFDRCGRGRQQQKQVEKQRATRATIAFKYFSDTRLDAFSDEADDEDCPLCRVSTTSGSRIAFEEVDSTSVLCWYFAVLALNERVQTRDSIAWPQGARLDLEDESVRQRAIELIIAAHKGDVTKDSFTTLYPDADDRPEAVDLIWLHVERAAQQVESVRACVRATLDDVVDRQDLMNPSSANGLISPGPVIETWMSDSIVPADVKAKFVREVAVLEDVPEHEKDWHPGSNQQVLDLVHPSLYCCVLGETMQVSKEQLKSSDETSVAERMHEMLSAELQIVEVKQWPYETNYLWIPSDFHVDVDGRVKILSYINNLHPVRHEAMYQSIETIFSKFVPLFDRVLGWLAQPREPEPSLEDETDIGRYYYYYNCIVPLFPDVPGRLEMETPSPTPFTMCGKTVQVITKIAEIHLTPENPTYPGGSWHIEGTETENIVATGIYYFGCDNITESKLSFRVIVAPPKYEQSDDLGMAVMYGLEHHEALVQDLGAATALEDRCIVFPNTLQHKVEPFQLEDPSRPGVRKILAFFLVDPSKKIPSTSVIPPQQEEWLKEVWRQALRDAVQLPETVVDDVLAYSLPSGMSLETAREHRDGLMEERGPFDVQSYGITFNLCEH